MPHPNVGPVFLWARVQPAANRHVPPAQAAGPIYNKTRAEPKPTRRQTSRRLRLRSQRLDLGHHPTLHQEDHAVNASGECGAREHRQQAVQPRGVQGAKRDRIVAITAPRIRPSGVSKPAAAGSRFITGGTGGSTRPTNALPITPMERTCRRLGVTVRTTVDLVAGHLLQASRRHQVLLDTTLVWTIIMPGPIEVLTELALHELTCTSLASALRSLSASRIPAR